MATAFCRVVLLILAVGVWRVLLILVVVADVFVVCAGFLFGGGLHEFVSWLGLVFGCG